MKMLWLGIFGVLISLNALAADRGFCVPSLDSFKRTQVSKLSEKDRAKLYKGYERIGEVISKANEIGSYRTKSGSGKVIEFKVGKKYRDLGRSDCKDHVCELRAFTDIDHYEQVMTITGPKSKSMKRCVAGIFYVKYDPSKTGGLAGTTFSAWLDLMVPAEE